MKREVWLILSSFGIMFAIISWMQEALIIPSASELNWRKGLYALISGLIIYLVFRKEA